MKSITDVDWSEVGRSLTTRGFARIERFLSEEVCRQATALYGEPGLFRSTINMQRHRFGQGEYKYFTYPLPVMIQNMREGIFERLAPIANDWMEWLMMDVRYPGHLQEFLLHCHSKGQVRPTPLLLRYEAGGYNTLHQDMYGDVFFPFQVVFLLARPGEDFEGGELVFVEQLPRAQSRAHVVKPAQGDAIIFTTNFRPVKGSKGYYRAKMKHGVSEVTKGLRYTAGIIFHDAL